MGKQPTKFFIGFFLIPKLPELAKEAVLQSQYKEITMYPVSPILNQLIDPEPLKGRGEVPLKKHPVYCELFSLFSLKQVTAVGNCTKEKRFQKPSVIIRY